MCRLLLRRTRIPLYGKAAEDLNERAPLDGCSEDFREEISREHPEAEGAIICASPSSESADAEATSMLMEVLEVTFPMKNDKTLMKKVETNLTMKNGKTGRGALTYCSELSTLSEVERAMGSRDVFLLILSMDLLKQPRCLKEIAAAFDMCKKVVGVARRGCVRRRVRRKKNGTIRRQLWTCYTNGYSPSQPWQRPLARHRP